MTATDHDNGLEALLYGDDELPDYDTPPPEARDLHVAEWHRRKVKALRERQQRHADLFAAAIEGLEERRAAAFASIEREAVWHESAIEAWHRKVFAAGLEGKTVKLPSGNSELRDSAPRVEVTDEDALRAFLVRAGVEDRMYPPKPVVLSKRALNEWVASVRRRGPDPEPGSIVPVVSPDGEEVPGVRFRKLAPRWQRGGKV